MSASSASSRQSKLTDSAPMAVTAAAAAAAAPPAAAAAASSSSSSKPPLSASKSVSLASKPSATAAAAKSTASEPAVSARASAAMLAASRAASLSSASSSSAASATVSSQPEFVSNLNDLSEIIKAASRRPAKSKAGFETGAQYPTRLLLGEGTFSYSMARLNKYGPDDSFIASEYDSKKNILRRLPAGVTAASFEEQLEILAPPGQLQRILLFSLDATRVHLERRLHPSYPTLRRYRCVHFNMPYVAHEVIGTGDLVAASLLSIKRVQSIGDRVFMALADTAYHQAEVYRIRSASGAAGYRLVRKNQFYDRFTRYGYRHATAAGGNVTSDKVQFAHEFVFKKVAEGALPRELVNMNDLFDGDAEADSEEDEVEEAEEEEEEESKEEEEEEEAEAAIKQLKL